MCLLGRRYVWRALLAQLKPTEWRESSSETGEIAAGCGVFSCDDEEVFLKIADQNG